MAQSHLLLSGAVVFDAALQAGQFAAQFAPIPALAPVFSVVQGIIRACAQIQSNREQAQQLQVRCQHLMSVLNDENYQVHVGPRMSDVAAGCATHLKEVLTVISRSANLNRLKSFIAQQQISDDIRNCHTRIDDCCKEFEIRSHMQLHHWQEEFNAAYQEDQVNLTNTLMRLREDTDTNSQMLAEVGGNVVLVLQLLQTALRSSLQDSEQYRALEQGMYKKSLPDPYSIMNLYRIQKRSGELPPDTDLQAGEARRLGKYPAGGNAAFDIWEGIWLGKEKVALKTIRGVHVSPETRKRFQREVTIWREVWHLDRGCNILPFYGACFTDGPYPYMVSPWMNNGDVVQYLEKYPTANRREIIKGIANGLKLLHGLEPKPIAHGDVKAANILIDDSGQPLLADFGLSKILEDITGVPFTQSKGVSESYRWFAPELCSAPGVISTYSDVFAYGMTVVEIMTGQPPFSHIKRTTEVLIEMQKGERPRKPTDPEIRARGLDDHLWEVITECWTEDPEVRPTISQVLAKLQ